MNKIITYIKQKEAFVSMSGASEKEVIAAEKELMLTFANDYRAYVLEFGAASYMGHELTGVCKSNSLNVVIVTKEEREFNNHIPNDWYVIEQTHMDGIVIWQDTKGHIYITDPQKTPKKICNSLIEYIRSEE